MDLKDLALLSKPTYREEQLHLNRLSLLTIFYLEFHSGSNKRLLVESIMKGGLMETKRDILVIRVSISLILFGIVLI